MESNLLIMKALKVIAFIALALTLFYFAGEEDYNDQVIIEMQNRGHEEEVMSQVGPDASRADIAEYYLNHYK